MNPSVVQQFLRRVSRRQKIVSLARQWRFFLLIAMGFYASALLASRLFGLLPGWFTPVTLAVFPTGALVLAWIFYHRTGVTDAARLADRRTGTHDLFLTASLIEHSLGAYQDLVLKDAEQRAAQMLPQKVVPFNWQRDTFRVCAALAVLTVAVYWLAAIRSVRLAPTATAIGRTARAGARNQQSHRSPGRAARTETHRGANRRGETGHWPISKKLFRTQSQTTKPARWRASTSSKRSSASSGNRRARKNSRTP